MVVLKVVNSVDEMVLIKVVEKETCLAEKKAPILVGRTVARKVALKVVKSVLEMVDATAA